MRRDVRDDDSAALVELIGSCWAEYPGVLLDIDGDEPWLRAPASYYASLGAGARFWVLDGADGLDACVGLKPHLPAVELKSLYVAGRARRRGLGGELVGVVEDAARAVGADRVELWSDSRFLDAHRLYERLGYRRTGSRELHDLSATTEYGYLKRL